MLYICDRSTPDLNKEDELNWMNSKNFISNDDTMISNAVSG